MTNYKKKKTKYIKISLIVLVVILAVICTGISLKKERNLNPVEKCIKDGILFIGESLYAPINYIKEKIIVYKEKDNIYKKYKKLQEETGNIEQKNMRIKELEEENKKLKEDLKIDYSLSDYNKVNATVISRNPGYWYNKLVINKGSKDGIKSKMAVITNSGVVGYISEVSKYTSNVQLLTSNNLKSKISIKIELSNGKHANGLIIGYDKKKNVYKVEGISYYGKIANDSIVTTTGLNDMFPSGIVIGKVVNITSDNFDLGKIVEVKPSVDFDDINFVTILKRKD